MTKNKVPIGEGSNKGVAQPLQCHKEVKDALKDETEESLQNTKLDKYNKGYKCGRVSGQQ